MANPQPDQIDRQRQPRERRGRGAAVNPVGRFERLRAEPVDDGWEIEEDLPPLRTEVAVDRSRSVIVRNTSPDVPFDRSVNPYRGCEHGCTYCYARPSHAQLGLSPGLDFETRLVAKPDAPRLLEAALRKPGYRVAPIAIGTNTDPYQPIEKTWRVMRGVLELLAGYRHPLTITTKGALVTRDLDILGQIERSILPAAADPSRFAVNPMAYLPIFVPPFQLLSLLPPAAGYWIWTAVNLGAFALYLRYFTRRMGQRPASARSLLLVLASLPVFLNLFAGQVAVWLAIFTGEFLLALSAGKLFRAGLWLGGLLLKPHLLVLIGLVLLLQRSFRALAGLAVTASALLAACLLLSGPAAVLRMLELWLIQGTGSGYSGVWLEGQMNWRMLAFHLSALVDARLATGMAVVGMLSTLVITLYVWRRPFDLRESSPAIAVLGIFAASAVLAWHSHINTAMLLIPAILYLAQVDVLPSRALAWWVFLPASLFVVVTFMPQILGQLNLFTDSANRFIYFFIGAAEFAVTLYLFLWAASAYSRRVYPASM